MTLTIKPDPKTTMNLQLISRNFGRVSCEVGWKPANQIRKFRIKLSKFVMKFRTKFANCKRF
jgi:hypothetical protein